MIHYGKDAQRSSLTNNITITSVGYCMDSLEHATTTYILHFSCYEQCRLHAYFCFLVHFLPYNVLEFDRPFQTVNLHKAVTWLLPEGDR